MSWPPVSVIRFSCITLSSPFIAPASRSPARAEARCDWGPVDHSGGDNISGVQYDDPAAPHPTDGPVVAAEAVCHTIALQLFTIKKMAISPVRMEGRRHRRATRTHYCGLQFYYYYFIFILESLPLRFSSRNNNNKENNNTTAPKIIIDDGGGIHYVRRALLDLSAWWWCADDGSPSERFVVTFRYIVVRIPLTVAILHTWTNRPDRTEKGRPEYGPET